MVIATFKTKCIQKTALEHILLPWKETLVVAKHNSDTIQLSRTDAFAWTLFGLFLQNTPKNTKCRSMRSINDWAQNQSPHPRGGGGGFERARTEQNPA